MAKTRADKKLKFKRVSRVLLKSAGWVDVAPGTFEYTNIAYYTSDDQIYQGSGAIGWYFETPDGKEVYITEGLLGYELTKKTDPGEDQ